MRRKIITHFNGLRLDSVAFEDFAATDGSGNSTNFIPAVPAAWSVRTIAFIPRLLFCLLANTYLMKWCCRTLLFSFFSFLELYLLLNGSKNWPKITGPWQSCFQQVKRPSTFEYARSDRIKVRSSQPSEQRDNPYPDRTRC